MYSRQSNNQYPVAAPPPVKPEGILPPITNPPPQSSIMNPYPPHPNQMQQQQQQQQQQQFMAVQNPLPPVDNLKPFEGRKGDRIYKCVLLHVHCHPHADPIPDCQSSSSPSAPECAGSVTR
jgi:hypothetical protein